MPENSVADILGIVGDTFDSVRPLFLLVVGVLLAFIVLEFVVSLFRKNKEEE